MKVLFNNLISFLYIRLSYKSIINFFNVLQIFLKY